VPAFTFVSYWSFRWHAPIVIVAILVIAFLTPDTADVRTTQKDGERQTLEAAVAQWAKANGCDVAVTDPGRKCPSPIIVSVAGGASRSAFLFGAVVGKLLDETHAKDGTPLRPFGAQLFAISGVSGGSLGASVTYAALADSITKGGGARGQAAAPPCKPKVHDTEWFGHHMHPEPQPEASWRACLESILAGDFLSPVMLSLFTTDLFGIAPRGDRAVILENAWERRYAHYTGQDPQTTTLAQPLIRVRREALSAADTGWLPMLVLGGTSVTTGRRILTSDIDTLLSAKLNNLRGRLFRDAYDLHELIAPTAEVARTAFNTDGSQVVVIYAGGRAPPEVWDTRTGTVLGQVAIGPALEEAEWSPKGDYIVAWLRSEEDVRIIRNQDKGQPVVGAGKSVIISPDGTRLLSEKDEGLVLWDAATGSKVLEMKHNNLPLSYTAFSPDGRTIVAMQDAMLVVFNAATGAVEKTFPDFGHQDRVGVTANRRFIFAELATEGGHRVQIRDFATGEVVMDTSYTLRMGTFSREGTRLVYAPLKGGAIRIRDVAAGSEIELPRGSGDRLSQPAFSRDGRRIMFMNDNGGVTVLDTATGAEITTVRGQEGRVKDAKFTPDGMHALTLSDNGLGRLWNLETGEEMYVIRTTETGEDCLRCDVALSTASTLSARFPIVSPHGNIRNGRSLVDRVVDGGYYENFGALTALELADQLRLLNLDPRIILINNEPAASGMSCITRDSQIALPRPPDKITFATLRSPMVALYATGMARGTHAAVDLCSRIGGGDKFAFITVVPDKRDKNATLSMSWWLSKHVQQYLDRQVDTENTENNAEAFRTIAGWRR
jgi:WD40 repeat protein